MNHLFNDLRDVISDAIKVILCNANSVILKLFFSENCPTKQLVIEVCGNLFKGTVNP